MQDLERHRRGFGLPVHQGTERGGEGALLHGRGGTLGVRRVEERDVAPEVAVFLRLRAQAPPCAMQPDRHRRVGGIDRRHTVGAPFDDRGRAHHRERAPERLALPPMTGERADEQTTQREQRGTHRATGNRKGTAKERVERAAGPGARTTYWISLTSRASAMRKRSVRPGAGSKNLPPVAFTLTDPTLRTSARFCRAISGETRTPATRMVLDSARPRRVLPLACALLASSTSTAVATSAVPDRVKDPACSAAVAATVCSGTPGMRLPANDVVPTT